MYRRHLEHQKGKIRKNIPCHVKSKTLKIQKNESKLKAARKLYHVISENQPFQTIAHFSTETQS